MSFLEVSGIVRHSSDGPVLRGITFTQQRLEKIAIAGETGSGKSSLLKIVAGLGQADDGVVMLEGQRVEGAGEKLVPGHPAIAYLSQHFELPRFLRVEQVLSYSSTMDAVESARLYDLCQVSHLLKRKTDQLSGGERQRIALARDLSRNPSLLLLDEPFSNLDVIHKNTLREVVDDLSRELDITVTLVSHDADDSLPWAQTIIVMKDGAIVQMGSPRDVYFNPADEYCAGLFGSFNVLTPHQQSLLGVRDGCIIRPAHLEISHSPRRNSAEGTLETLRFFGSFAELDITLGNGVLKVLTTDQSWSPRDIVHIVFNPDPSQTR